MVAKLKRATARAAKLLPTRRGDGARQLVVVAIIAAGALTAVAVILLTMGAIKGDYNGYAAAAILSIFLALWGWVVGLGMLIEEHFGRRRQSREQSWPEHEKVTGNSYRLPLTIVHTVSFEIERPAFSNTEKSSHRFKAFPYVLSPVASSPEKNEVGRVVTCPECGDTLLLLATQRVFVLLTEEDFASEQHGRILRYAFVRRRLMTFGSVLGFGLIVPSFLAGLATTSYLVGLGVWVAATAVTLGIVAVAYNGGPTKPTLFMVNGSRSVLWRVIDHSRFFNLVRRYRLVPVGKSTARHSAKHPSDHSWLGLGHDDFSLRGPDLKTVYNLEFDRLSTL